MTRQPQADPEEAAVDFQMTFSRHFGDWLAQEKISLAFTNPPQKVFFVGLQRDGQLSLYERTFMRCLGIASPSSETIYVSTRYQIWRLENALPPDQQHEDAYDRLYIPRKVYTTGAVGTHDVVVEGDGRVVFVNTRFGCLATVSDTYSFAPIWHPPFLPGPISGDRCHLNGVAVRDGRIAYATSVSQTAEFDSWRDHRQGGGVVMEIATSDIVCGGLSMPHSPRWYRGKLWVPNAGTGEFGYVDLDRGSYEVVTFCPGFLRGLAFVGNYAIIGSSKPRHGDIYSGLGLDERLERHRQRPRLGLFIVDLRTGAIVHWLFIEGQVRELYDVVTLPDVRQPMALGLISNEIERSIWFDERLPGLQRSAGLQ
jgi:uncharacterized protein (TIGR03032 family)